MKIDGVDLVDSIEVPEEMEFRYGGCENCANNLGNNVYKVKAHVRGFTDYYDLFLCHGCVCTYYNADPLPEDCKNAFEL